MAYLSKIKLNGVTYNFKDSEARAAIQQGSTGTLNITNTLTSGELIATINGTNIYAPFYTDGDNLSY